MISYATAGPGAAGGALGGMIFPLLMMGLFVYFLMIKPQKKRQQQMMDMRSSLKVGDQVILYSGLVGEIVEIEDDNLVLKIEPNETLLTFKNWAIREVVIDDEDSEEDIEDLEEDVEDVEDVEEEQAEEIDNEDKKDE